MALILPVLVLLPSRSFRIWLQWRQQPHHETPEPECAFFLGAHPDKAQAGRPMGSSEATAAGAGSKQLASSSLGLVSGSLLPIVCLTKRSFWRLWARFLCRTTIIHWLLRVVFAGCLFITLRLGTGGLLRVPAMGRCIWAPAGQLANRTKQNIRTSYSAWLRVRLCSSVWGVRHGRYVRPRLSTPPFLGGTADRS